LVLQDNGKEKERITAARYEDIEEIHDRPVIGEGGYPVDRNEAIASASIDTTGVPNLL
jgi:hypothetical protein